LTVKEKELLDLIKSKGYWEIEISPYTFKADRLELDEILQLVKKSQVHKWGRYYPLISQSDSWSGESFRGNNYWESITDDGSQHRELWRMYQSGQFIHYVALREDWGYKNDIGLYAEVSRKIQSIILTLYTVTEIFLFVSRLASDNLFEDYIYMNLKLHGADDRQLVFSTPDRTLYDNYICRIEGPITIENTVSVTDVMSNSPRLAMDTVIRIFRLFNWNSTQIADILRNDQEKILKEL